jgi:hypothetical protein
MIIVKAGNRELVDKMINKKTIEHGQQTESIASSYVPPTTTPSAQYFMER